MKQLEIIKPDDWHVHFRDGEILKAVVPQTTKHFARSIVMPNLIPPIITGKQAKEYKNKILRATPKNHNFTPLMTVYLTENAKSEEIKTSYECNDFFAAKLYPAGATTNSASGVKDIKKIMPILETMSDIGMPLLIHGEITDKTVDIFDREKFFLDTTLDFIHKELPELKITMEHITTEEAVQYVSEGNFNLAASVTPHHLSLNRNAIFEGGIRPHHYCLPILKKENHRKALVKAVTQNNKKFFLGTDTAPHLINDKENSCGCAGIFNATYCMSILTDIFEAHNSINTLENFVSINGAKHYGLKINKERMRLTKYSNPITFDKKLKFNNKEIIIFLPNKPIYWKVEN